MTRSASFFCLLALALGLLYSGGEASGQAAAGRPNILLAIADDWSNGHASCFGTPWIKTPAFDRVAREGALGENFFTSNPKCSPCRASLLTGRNSWQLEEACCHFGVFPKKWPVYPDLLEEAGYHVGFTGKGWGPGDFAAGGFKRNPAGPAFNTKRLTPPLSGINAIDYAANFKDFLEKRAAGQPFCFWYGATEPHLPYETGSGVRAGKKLRDVELPGFYPDSNIIRGDLLDYAVEVEWFDRHLGRMLEELERRGELDNTLVVVTSDHGMPLPRVKGQIYEQGFHLPLAIRWGRRIRAGTRLPEFLNIRDLMPTFLQAAGLPAPAAVTGRSFLDLLRGSEQTGARRDRMLIGKERHDLGRPYDWGYPVRALRTPEFLYIRNYEPERWPVCNPETGYNNCDSSPTKHFILSRFDSYYRLNFGKRPEEELYRMPQDIDCLNNLAGDPEYARVRGEMRREMEEMLRAEGDPRASGKGEIFEAYRYTGSRHHSYDNWLKHRR